MTANRDLDLQVTANALLFPVTSAQFVGISSLHRLLPVATPLLDQLIVRYRGCLTDVMVTRLDIHMITTWLTLACVLGACTDRRPPPTSEPYVMMNDGGGQLISAEADRAMLRAWGGRVEVRGRCNSACIIFTTLPNACIESGAKLGFHGSNVNVGPIGNQQMAKYMRGGVRKRYLAEWQFIPPTDIHQITAQEYVRLDPKTKICPPR